MGEGLLAIALSTDPSSVTTYGHDRAGNRTSVQVGAGLVVTTTYDSASLPTASSDGLTFTYDAMGTLVTVDKSGGSTGDQCFAYDGFGLLASFKANSTTGCGQGSGDVQYAYDALGRTVSRVGASTTTSNFILDGEDLARTTTAGTATAYAFSPEGLMASSTGGSARFFLKDLHGDTVGAVNASGTVMGSKLYSPWGEPAASAGETYTPGFQSQPTDADTGYVDMTTRLYAPTQGRFSTRDVLFGDTSSPASMNQYGYAEGSPITMWDPSGMAKQSAQGCDVSVHNPHVSRHNPAHYVHAQAQWKCNEYVPKFVWYLALLRCPDEPDGVSKDDDLADGCEFAAKARKGTAPLPANDPVENYVPASKSGAYPGAYKPGWFIAWLEWVKGPNGCGCPVHSVGESNKVTPDDFLKYR